VILELQGHKDLQVPKDYRVIRVLLDLQGLKDLRVRQELRGYRGLREIQVQLVLLAMSQLQALMI
jgi:hypothetical protein